MEKVDAKMDLSKDRALEEEEEIVEYFYTDRKGLDTVYIQE